MTTIKNTNGWVYCFKRGDKAVFLNRKDQVIKEFCTYDEAEQYAKNNIHLIDEIKTDRFAMLKKYGYQDEKKPWKYRPLTDKGIF